MALFVSLGALEHAAFHLEPQSHQQTSWVSQFKEERRVTDTQPGNFPITSACANSVVPSQYLSNPVLLFGVRPDLALEDRTPYELALMLRDAGWTCQSCHALCEIVYLFGTMRVLPKRGLLAWP